MDSLLVIDSTESVKFTFDAGAATNVSLMSYLGELNSGDGNVNLQGFGVGGVSLGIESFNFVTWVVGINVSAQFGNVPLSGFAVEGDGTSSGVSVGTVTFTPGAAVVPEPSTALVAVAGMLAGLAVWARRRWRAIG